MIIIKSNYKNMIIGIDSYNRYYICTKIHLGTFSFVNKKFIVPIKTKSHDKIS